MYISEQLVENSMVRDVKATGAHIFGLWPAAWRQIEVTKSIVTFFLQFSHLLHEVEVVVVPIANPDGYFVSLPLPLPLPPPLRSHDVT